MNEFFSTLLSLTVGGSVLAALLLGVKALLGKKLPSMFYYYAWLLVLLRFLLPIPGVAHYERVVPESAQSVAVAWDSGAVRPAAYQNPTGYHVDYIGMVPQEAPEESPLELPKEPASAADQQLPEPIQQPTAPTQPRKAPALSLTLTPAQWILAIWAGGAALSILFFLLSYGRFIRALNKTLRRPRLRDLEIYRDLDGPRRLRLLRSGGVSTPMQLGLLCPKLILPEREYTNGMLENILRHELTHYTRHDILYKWFALTVCCLHWFNPLMWIIRRELDRACELSCDERLLKSMTVQEKRSYGETLLALASDRALPRRVIATSFATEKRNLKERLEQIMTYQHMGKTTIVLAMCVCVLLGCFAVAAGPAQAAQMPEGNVPTETVNAPELTEDPAGTERILASEPVTVSTVDEFLAAIAPGANIVLKDGDYNLTRASNYPQKDENELWEEMIEGRVIQGSDYYCWIPRNDGYSLSINSVNGLTIQAEEGASVQIMTSPRYADVLHFEGCQGISLSNLTMGHTIEKGLCAGGVLDFEGTDNVVVDGCALYGCGTWGVYARYCQQMQVIGSRIYDCSEGAVQLGMCRDVQVDSCEIYECTASYGGLLNVWQSEQIAFTNSRIYNNKDVQFLIEAYDRSQGVYMGGLLVEHNKFENALYTCTQDPITFSHCDIRPSNTMPGGFKGGHQDGLNYFTAVSPEGKELSDDDANFHSQKKVLWRAEMKLAAPEAVEPDADGVIRVSNVDEFLAAIGPYRTVYLEPGDYDLTTASDYGKLGGYYYTWSEEFDGYSLTLQNITGLTIAGAGVDKVNIVTVPRYADVLLLQNCEDIILRAFTAGHTIEPGYCAGDVLQMENCRRIEVSGCSLFGCGVYGVNGYSCDTLNVANTEIHHCSQGVALLFGCTNVSFTDCDIHDNFFEYEHDGKLERFDANEVCTEQRNYPVESGKDYFF